MKYNSGGQSRGKALFNRCAERENEPSEEPTSAAGQAPNTSNVPGLDFEEIEDEFDRLHKEMMGEE